MELEAREIYINPIKEKIEFVSLKDQTLLLLEKISLKDQT